MKTEVTKLLGIEYPIIQGGMAWVAEYHLAAAVSEAGGLGLIGAASAPAEWVRQQVQEVKKLTDKPFGVNIMLMSPYADEIAKVIVEEKVPVVTTGAGTACSIRMPLFLTVVMASFTLIPPETAIAQYSPRLKPAVTSG